MRRDELLGELADRIARLRPPHPVRVGIDGVDAAGKTTLADELVAPLQRRGRRVIRSSVDRFHNPRAVRMRRGGTSPEGYYRDSFDYPTLVRVLLEPLGPGGSLRHRVAAFDHSQDAPVDARVERAAPDAVLLFDGIFLHRPELRRYWDFSIFLRARFEVTLTRAEARDQELIGDPVLVRGRYEERYVPGQKLYLAEVDPERWADVVIDHDDPAQPRLLPADGRRV